MKTVTITADGSCLGNPGRGGWAVILRFGTTVKELSGGELMTTNNKMELTAAIQGLKVLKEPCIVEFTTDSEYVRLGITEWISNWKINGWRTAAKKPVANKELWEELDALVSKHTVHWHWTKGHAGHPDNERCDVLARQAAEMQIIRPK